MRINSAALPAPKISNIPFTRIFRWTHYDSVQFFAKNRSSRYCSVSASDARYFVYKVTHSSKIVTVQKKASTQAPAKLGKRCMAQALGWGGPSRHCRLAYLRDARSGCQGLGWDDPSLNQPEALVFNSRTVQALRLPPRAWTAPLRWR